MTTIPSLIAERKYRIPLVHPQAVSRQLCYSGGMHRKFRRSHVLIILLILSLGIALFVGNRIVRAPSPPSESKNSNITTPSSDNSSKTTPPEPTYDTTTASSLQVIVNKQHPLSPIDYTPASLKSVGNGQQMRDLAADAFLQMKTAAAAGGSPIAATSAYRSYSYQKSVYGGYVQQYGVAQSDTFSARPGYSEHQTGLAVDIQGGGCSLDNCFANTPQGKWLAANAYIYGFILRYTADKTAVTGYEHEAWHYRFVGIPLATDMHTKGIETLEEYFHASGGPSY